VEFNDAIETHQDQDESKPRMLDIDRLKEKSRVIGYFAYTEDGHVLCDGDACIIAGSEESMKSYLEEPSASRVKKFTVRKTRFGEIIDGIVQGGIYAFDSEAYPRFFQYLKVNGLSDFPSDIPSGPEGTNHFVRFGRSDN